LPKQKEEQVEDSSLDPSSSACDIRIQKKGISRSFAESFPQKIVSAKLRPHCSATCPNTWKAEPRKKNTLSFHHALCACDQSVSGLLSKYIRNSSNEFRKFAEHIGRSSNVFRRESRIMEAVPPLRSAHRRIAVSREKFLYDFGFCARFFLPKMEKKSSLWILCFSKQNGGNGYYYDSDAPISIIWQFGI